MNTHFLAVYLLFCFAGGVYVDSNPVVSANQRSHTVTFPMSNTFNVLIEEANRCPLLTGSCLCPWKWILDVDSNRIPNVIYKAEKLLGAECETDPEKECRSESKRFNVMRLSPNLSRDYNLVPGDVELPVGFFCSDKLQRPVINGEHAYSMIRD
uniref:Uncharacterized protein n=1 Tax=Magallana gigas TaxID=29159 RepID=A0A8W8P0T5_MAGGI